MPIVPQMPMSEFYKRRSVYEKRARDRMEERLNHQDADVPYPFRLLEEMVMDLLKRQEALAAEVDDRLSKVEDLLAITKE